MQHHERGKALPWDLGVLAGVSALSIVLAVALGAIPLSLTEVVFSLLGQAPDDKPWAAQVVLGARLPRALVAWIVGASLSVSGAALQTLFRNPLAEPGVLGVSSMASLGAVVVITLGWATASSAAVPLAAAGGALLATGLLWVGGRWTSGTQEPLLLLGVAVGQLGAALSSLIMSLVLAQWDMAQRILIWMLGGLDGRSWVHVSWGAPPVVVALAWLLLQSRALDALLLGDSTALSLGVDVPRLRRRLIVVGGTLAGVSVAVGGLVAFVGLVVPHFVRRWSGPLHARLLPRVALVGGTFVVLADLLARRLVAPEEMRLGVVTALLGAPLFLYLLLQRSRSASLAPRAGRPGT